MKSRHRLCAAQVEEYAQNEVRSTSIASTTLLKARKADVAPDESVEIFMILESDGSLLKERPFIFQI